MGIIHVVPLVGLLGPERLASMYGIAVDEPNALLLMRHRAVLFGILGTFLIVAALVPKMQALALAAGFVSVVSFLALAWSSGGYNPEVGRVVTADVVALGLLLVALAAKAWLRQRG